MKKYFVFVLIAFVFMFFINIFSQSNSQSKNQKILLELLEKAKSQLKPGEKTSDDVAKKFFEITGRYPRSYQLSPEEQEEFKKKRGYYYGDYLPEEEIIKVDEKLYLRQIALHLNKINDNLNDINDNLETIASNAELIAFEIAGLKGLR